MSVNWLIPSVNVTPGPINRLGSHTVLIRTEWYSKWNLDARYRHYSVQNDIFKCPSIYINSRQRIYVEDCQDWQWASNDGSLDYFYLTWTLTADRSTVRFDATSRTWMSMKLTYVALLEMNIWLWQDLVYCISIRATDFNVNTNTFGVFG